MAVSCPPRKREITASIVRNMDKCIFCRRCESVCNDVQTVGALGAIRRGFNTTIAPAFDRMMTESECTYCGQCVAVCPVGALTERDYTTVCSTIWLIGQSSDCADRTCRTGGPR